MARPPRLNPRWTSARLAYGPTTGELRAILTQMQRRLGEDRVALLLGIPMRTLRNWRTGANDPDGPARRLIWTYGCLVFRPELLRTFFSIATWGRFEEVKRERPADDWQI